MIIDNDTYRKKIAQSALDTSIIVQAGPGSGKTTLLVERLKYIIENRRHSHSGIACITYTNVAKDEIITRLQKENYIQPKELFIGTIHSFLHENLIKPYSHLINRTNQPFRVTTNGFARGLKNEIASILNRSPFKLSEGDFRNFESLGYDENGKPCCYRSRVSAQNASKWKSILHEKGLIDQQDVIYLSYKILNEFEHIKKAFSSRFPNMLIDEYQDVTYFQEKIFESLESTSFFCVGDYNQSIFSFTGAEPKIFNSNKNNKKFKKYDLLNNFRSTRNIVEFSNLKSDLIQNVFNTYTSTDKAVVFFKDIKDFDGAIRMFQQERLKITTNQQYKPYLILTRYNKNLKEIKQIVQDKNNIEGNSFLEKLKKNHYRRYLILKNLLIAIAYKKRHDLNKAMDHISESLSYLMFNSHPAYVSLSEIKYDAFMWKKLHVFVLHFLTNPEIENLNPNNLFETLKTFLLNQSIEVFKLRIGRKLKMLDYDWNGQKRTVSKIKISDLINDIVNEHELSKHQENIYSIHSAKGMEAECVLVIAETTKQIKEWLNHNNTSEEARVGYVAFTRARKLLCIWSPNLKETEFERFDNVQFI
ncbi:ATP-dependent helicase [Bacillus swezeyi]|uniref:ATP-dependent helicase n=1 Tax=Bacillus swezeyi TaxID=1925020 RepID=UPI0027DCFC18|nr:ATP-dependent helicase [Bacillus swezeyi]